MTVKVIFNPASAQGRARGQFALLDSLLEELDLHYTIVATSRLEEIAIHAARAREEGYDLVAAVGGDGTFREVARGLLEATSSSRSAREMPVRQRTASGATAGTLDSSGPKSQALPLALIPSGTGNGTAYSLGLPVGLFEAVRLLKSGREKTIDVARVNGDIFLNIAGAGLDAEVAGMAKKLPYIKGIPAYAITTLNYLHNFESLELTMDIDGKKMRRQVLLVAIGNGGYYGMGLNIIPAARVDDGWLDVCLVEEMSPLELTTFLPLLLAGRHGQHPRVKTLRGKKISITSDRPARLHRDGDLTGVTPAVVEVVPGALKVLAPGIAAR
ncbi:MAG: diacylglycerol kinase family lipid kinase [Firmicutes bacterium]|nr:diacylglycerol kinase family lipid kinase [Bacillota bacterium]MCL5039963.1 diacylglycerol kinase family lipid kinase [Bacillota bacterium]